MKVMRQRRPPFRSDVLRDAARNEPCVHCGKLIEGETVGAHYTGVRQGDYGRGIGQKAHDYLIAHLCADCHVLMDTISKSKEDRWEHSERFLHAIALTWARLFERGILQVKR